MERHEIDAAVVSTGPPGAFLGDAGRARELARIANEGIADVVRGAPDRFAGARAAAAARRRRRARGDQRRARPALARRRDALDARGRDLPRRSGLGSGARRARPPRRLRLRAPDAPAARRRRCPTTRCGSTSSRSTRRGRSPTSSTPARSSATPDPLPVRPSRRRGAVPRASARLAGRPRAAAAAAAPAGALEYLRRLYYDTGLSNNAPALRRRARSPSSTTSSSAPTGRTPRCPTVLRPRARPRRARPGRPGRGGGGEHRERSCRGSSARAPDRAMPALVVLGRATSAARSSTASSPTAGRRRRSCAAPRRPRPVEALGARAIRADVADPAQLRDALGRRPAGRLPR